jgi:hypothetical protein
MQCEGVNKEKTIGRKDMHERKGEKIKDTKEREGDTFQY